MSFQQTYISFLCLIFLTFFFVQAYVIFHVKKAKKIVKKVSKGDVKFFIYIFFYDLEIAFSTNSVCIFITCFIFQASNKLPIYYSETFVSSQKSRRLGVQSKSCCSCIITKN